MGFWNTIDWFNVVIWLVKSLCLAFIVECQKCRIRLLIVPSCWCLSSWDFFVGSGIFYYRFFILFKQNIFFIKISYRRSVWLNLFPQKWKTSIFNFSFYLRLFHFINSFQIDSLRLYFIIQMFKFHFFITDFTAVLWFQVWIDLSRFNW